MKPDHTHKCCACGKVWSCRHFDLKHCRSGGVFKAVQVNGDGPYCETCRLDIMRQRKRELRRANKAIRSHKAQ